MQEKMKSEGKCLFCGKTFAKAGIHRHLATHLKEKAAAGSPGKSFLIKVEPHKKMETFPYFLSLWIDGETEMDDIDDFLRKIWLDCCWHKSEFWKKVNVQRITQKVYWETLRKMKEENRTEDECIQFMLDNEYSKDDDVEVISMENKAKIVFQKSKVLNYDYDFGMPTSLVITVIEEYQVKAESEIVLLSRNEPLAIMCKVCEKMPATKLCTCHWQFSVFCDECAKEHAKECNAFNEYSSRLVVNSPRMGDCVYRGGSIDKERDGVFYRR